MMWVRDMIQKLSGLRFSAASSEVKKHTNPGILLPLGRLVPQSNTRQEVDKEAETVVSLAAEWVKDPQGAITTLAEVLKQTRQEMLAQVPVPRQKGITANKNPHTAFVSGRLDRFLGFFRREFWETSFPGRIIREFNTSLSRNQESALNAYQKGIPAGKGAWREFFAFVRTHAPQEFIAGINKLLPEGTPKLPDPGAPPKQSGNPDLPDLPAYKDDSPHRGLFRPDEGDFID